MPLPLSVEMVVCIEDVAGEEFEDVYSQLEEDLRIRVSTTNHIMVGAIVDYVNTVGISPSISDDLYRARIDASIVCLFRNLIIVTWKKREYLPIYGMHYIDVTNMSYDEAYLVFLPWVKGIRCTFDETTATFVTSESESTFFEWATKEKIKVCMDGNILRRAPVNGDGTLCD